MEIKGIDSTFITSHMSLGNFREIDVEDLTKHKMDSEQMEITHETADYVNKKQLND
jgi:S-adenosylmethionine:tRNA ribosyltransferase-isomerase